MANSAEIVGRGENVRISGSMVHYLGLAQLELCWVLTKGSLWNELHSCFGEAAKRFNIFQAGRSDRARHPPNGRPYGMTYVVLKGRARRGALHGNSRLARKRKPARDTRVSVVHCVLCSAFDVALPTTRAF